MSQAVSAMILVVDDNEANRLLAQNTLEDEGYAVSVATGGKEALARLDEIAPDCILLDVRMPDLDGFAVCERIRQRVTGGDVPVIFLTALRDVDTFDHALRVGGDDFLTKPVRPTELVVRVQSALKLRRMRSELQEHYELLKRQRDDLMRVQLQKERLTAFVVHDLKNPVNAMDLHAQLLLRDNTLSEAARKSATQIRREARQLGRLILNLLDISKADEGRLAPARSLIDAAHLVADVFAELEVSARERSVTLAAETREPTFRGDPELLRRLLANLVENAIRHAPSGSKVTVTTTREGEWSVFRVADEGTGVPVDMREKIFDAFAQVEGTGDRVMRRTSRGLGLTFCRAVARAHGGDIFVEDTPTGASFCVRLADG